MLAGGADLELGCQEEGRGADATPDPQSSKLSCPRQDRPEATVTGLLKPKRFPSGVGAATGSRGQLEALIPVPLTPIKAQNRYSCRVGDSEATHKGSSSAGRGHAIRIPPSHPDAPIRQNRKEARNRSLQDGPWPAVRLGRGGGMAPRGGSPLTPATHRAWATDLR